MGRIERIKIKKNRFLIKVRNSFRGQRKKELLTFVVFLFISSFFWLLQWMKEDIETDFSIPVEIVNVPRNILLTSELPTNISINVKDKGATILSYYFSRPMPGFQINYRDLKLARGVASVSSYVITSQLKKKFVQSLEITAVYPEMLTLQFSKGESKVVPVSLLTSISTIKSSGVSGAYQVFPAKVTIYAPTDKLKEITTVYTDVVRVENAKDTLTRSVSIQKIEGVRIVPEMLKVIVPIEPFTEKKLEVSLEGRGAPEGYTMRMFPVKVTVVCYVAISRYDQVKSEDFRLGVDFDNSAKDSDLKYRVKLIHAPEYVSKVRFQPSEVEVLMEENR